MGCNQETCGCAPNYYTGTNVKTTSTYTITGTGGSYTVRAEQPEGWHACLKQKTRCVIKVIDGVDFATGLLNIKEFEATNSCHVDDAKICPRVTAGSKSGEGYELCGPPNHAEAEAAKLLLEHYPDGAPAGATAYLYGHTWLCMDCQHALTAAGVKHFIVTGEAA